jgi:hypothetical protein
MDSLDVFRMVVSPCSSHTTGIDVVGDDVAVVGERFLAEGAYAILGDDLPVEELPHLAVGAKFPVSSGMLRVLDPADAHPTLALCSWDLLSSAADVGAVDRAELILAESHGCLLIGFGGLAYWESDEESCSLGGHSHRRNSRTRRASAFCISLSLLAVVLFRI